MLVNINATHIQHPLFIIQSTLHDKIKSRPTYVFTVTLITIISSISCRQLTSVRVCVCRLSSQQDSSGAVWFGSARFRRVDFTAAVNKRNVCVWRRAEYMNGRDSMWAHSTSIVLPLSPQDTPVKKLFSLMQTCFIHLTEPIHIVYTVNVPNCINTKTRSFLFLEIYCRFFFFLLSKCMIKMNVPIKV